MAKVWLLFLIATGLLSAALLLAGCESKQERALLEEAAANKGKELYFAYGCAACHGKTAEGDGISASSFSVRPTNLRDVRSYRHGYDQQSIQNVIRYGMRKDDSVMPAFGHIPQEELEELSLFVASLQKENTK